MIPHIKSGVFFPGIRAALAPWGVFESWDDQFEGWEGIWPHVLVQGMT